MRKIHFYLEELTTEELDSLLKTNRYTLDHHNKGVCHHCGSRKGKVYLLFTRILTRKDDGELFSLHQDCTNSYFKALKHYKQWRRIKPKELFYLNING